MRFGAGQSRKPAWSHKTRLSSCCLTSAVVSSVRAPGLRSITRQVHTLLRQLSRISQKVRAAEAEQFNPSRVDMGRLWRVRQLIPATVMRSGNLYEGACALDFPAASLMVQRGGGFAFHACPTSGCVDVLVLMTAVPGVVPLSLARGHVSVGN